MPLYSCDVCNFRSNLKSDYFRHLNTKKHKKNKAKQDENLKKNIKSPYNSLTNPHNCEGIPSQTLTIVREKKHTFLDHTDSEIYNCEKCGKEFSRKDNLKRHSEKYCGDSNPKNFKDLFLLMKEEHKQEKEDLKKQIEGLLTKVGNNISVGNKTNNTTINNTIVLNNYGQEDLSHITDALKTQLLKLPYGMIPKMIEHVHFNDQKPENKNIMLTNSRDNKLKIYKNNKWIYRDKNETLNTTAIQGVGDKAKAIKDIADKNNYNVKNILYVGNDINDYHAMQLCGHTACPADSHFKIKEISNFVLRAKGGDGIVRELLEDVFQLDFIQLLYLK